MATYGEQLIEEGRQEGRLEGLQVGLQEGRQEGRVEGRVEGRQEGRVATIENFLRAGVGWSMITQATGIDQEAFELLRRQTDPADRGRRVEENLG